MYDICNKNFDHFGVMFDNIEYISPDEDYNKYCIINKQNEERKGMSNFLTYLMRNNLIDTNNDTIFVITDHHFYEGIQKYDMFFAGWDDNDSVEVVVKNVDKNELMPVPIISVEFE